MNNATTSAAKTQVDTALPRLNAEYKVVTSSQDFFESTSVPYTAHYMETVPRLQLRVSNVTCMTPFCPMFCK